MAFRNGTSRTKIGRTLVGQVLEVGRSAMFWEEGRNSAAAGTETAA